MRMREGGVQLFFYSIDAEAPIAAPWLLRRGKGLATIPSRPRDRTSIPCADEEDTGPTHGSIWQLCPLEMFRCNFSEKI